MLGVRQRHDDVQGVGVKGETDVGLGRVGARVGMRMVDRAQVPAAIVHLGKGVELLLRVHTVRDGAGIGAFDGVDTHRAAVLGGYQATDLVGKSLASMCHQLVDQSAGNYHRNALSRPASREDTSAVHRSPLRYFQPPSGSRATMVPSLHPVGVTQGGLDNCAGRDAGKDAFFGRQPAHADYRVLVRDEVLPVEHTGVEDRGNIALRQTTQALYEISGMRLRGDYLDVRPLLLETPPHAGERAARSQAGHESIDFRDVP